MYSVFTQRLPSTSRASPTLNLVIYAYVYICVTKRDESRHHRVTLLYTFASINNKLSIITKKAQRTHICAYIHTTHKSNIHTQTRGSQPTITQNARRACLARVSLDNSTSICLTVGRLPQSVRKASSGIFAYIQTSAWNINYKTVRARSRCISRGSIRGQLRDGATGCIYHRARESGNVR